MRKGKVVLLVDANAERADDWRFILELQRFRVLVAHDVPGALGLHWAGVDIVMGIGGGGMCSAWPQLAEAMKQARPLVPIVLVGVAAEVGAANLILPHKTRRVEQVEHVRALLNRKRGPRGPRGPVLVANETHVVTVQS